MDSSVVVLLFRFNRFAQILLRSGQKKQKNLCRSAIVNRPL